MSGKRECSHETPDFDFLKFILLVLLLLVVVFGLVLWGGGGVRGWGAVLAGYASKDITFFIRHRTF